MKLLDVHGATWRPHQAFTRIYASFQDSHGNEVLYFTELPGLNPQNNRAWVQGKCRQALCRPETMDWERDTKQLVNPSLVVKYDLAESSMKWFGWPRELFKRCKEHAVESTVLDEVAAGIVEDSQD